MKKCQKCGILCDNIAIHEDVAHTNWAEIFENDPWDGEPEQGPSVSVRPKSTGKKVSFKTGKSSGKKVTPTAPSQAKKQSAREAKKKVKFVEKKKSHDTTIELSDSDDDDKKKPKRKRAGAYFLSNEAKEDSDSMDTEESGDADDNDDDDDDDVDSDTGKKGRQCGNAKSHAYDRLMAVCAKYESMAKMKDQKRASRKGPHGKTTRVLAIKGRSGGQVAKRPGTPHPRTNSKKMRVLSSSDEEKPAHHSAKSKIPADDSGSDDLFSDNDSEVAELTKNGSGLKVAANVPGHEEKVEKSAESSVLETDDSDGSEKDKVQPSTSAGTSGEPPAWSKFIPSDDEDFDPNDAGSIKVFTQNTPGNWMTQPEGSRGAGLDENQDVNSNGNDVNDSAGRIEPNKQPERPSVIVFGGPRCREQLGQQRVCLTDREHAGLGQRGAGGVTSPVPPQQQPQRKKKRGELTHVEIDEDESIDDSLKPYMKKMCTICVIYFDYCDDLDRHRWNCHRELYYNEDSQPPPNVDDNNAGMRFIELHNAFGVVPEYKLDMGGNVFFSISGLATAIKPLLRPLMLDLLRKYRSLNVMCCTEAEMFSPTKNITSTFFFKSWCHKILHESMIIPVFEIMVKKMLDSVYTLTMLISSWTMEKIKGFHVTVTHYDPLKAGLHFDLPPALQAKNCVVNIDCDDDRCFLFCIMAQLFPIYQAKSKKLRKKATRSSTYVDHIKKLKVTGLTFPMSIGQVGKFMSQNPKISVNVYSYEEGGEFYKTASGLTRKRPLIAPLFISSEKRETHVDLLLVTHKELNHFVLLKQSRRNMQSGLSALLGYQGRGQRFYCYNCLSPFRLASIRDDHVQFCSSHKPQKIMFPPKDFYSFSNFDHTLRLFYVGVGDFETVNKPIMQDDCPNGDNCKEYLCSKDHPGSTLKVAEMLPCGYSLLIVNGYDEIVVDRHYRGEDAAEHFVQTLTTVTLPLFTQLRENAKKEVPVLTPEQKREQEETTECYLCLKPFAPDEAKIIHHHHDFTRGPAHESVLGFTHAECNLNAKSRSNFIPIYFHNLAFDGQIVLQGAAKTALHKIDTIQETKEKIISLTLTTCEGNKIRIGDSLRFMPMSLDSLVSTLRRDGEDKFKFTRQVFPHCSDDDFKLLLRKGVYPYDYVSDFSKFDEPKLPPKEKFYSTLTESDISQEDYDHALTVFDKFKCSNLGDYMDLYVRTDTALLLDVFQQYRKMAFETFRLEPASYCTLPGMSQHAGQIMSKTVFEYIKDPTMYMWVEKSIRGGLTNVTFRRADANNKLMGDLYNPDVPSSYIAYLDMINLYGYALCQPLAYGGFSWLSKGRYNHMSPRELRQWVMSMDDYGDVGYFFEVNISFGEELHDLLNDFPPLAERMKVDYDDLSEYSKNILFQYGLDSKYLSQEKLVCTLEPKKNYILHYRLLKFVLSLGAKLDHVHRILRFSQRRWAEHYVMTCTKKRAEAKSEFLKMYYKLMVNSFYGRLIYNRRKHRHVILALNRDQVKSCARRPTFEGLDVLFGGGMVACYMRKGSVLLDSMVVAGSTVLELGKLRLLQFHYQYIRKFYSIDRCLLCMTDTDAAIYWIKTDDLYLDFKKHKELGENWIDFSGYKNCNDSRKDLYSTDLAGTPGYMKDELGTDLAIKGVFLVPKMYMLLGLNDKKEEKVVARKARGVKKSTKDKHLTYALYLECLENDGFKYVRQTSIRSFNHLLYVLDTHKRGLSVLDTKKFWISKYQCLSFGHKDIPKYE